MEHERNTPSGHGEVIKSALPGMMDPRAAVMAGADGGLLWPIDPLTLLLLYVASPEHARCIGAKAEGAFGGGLVWREGAKANAAEAASIPEFEDLCEQGSANLFQELGLDLGTYGNAFLQVIAHPVSGRPVRLRRLPALTMKRLGDVGFLQVITDDAGREVRAVFKAAEVIHFRDPCPMGHYYALPSWVAAGPMMDLVNQAVQWNRKFFSNSAMPEYIFTVKGATLSDAQKRAAQEFFRGSFGGVDNAHRTLFLQFNDKDVEVKAERVTAEVKDADFLKLLDAARDRIPMAHGVPPRIVGIVVAGSLGGTGEFEQQMQLFEQLTLSRIRERAIGHLGPVLRGLDLRREDVTFRPLDLTPPSVDREHLADMVQAGIYSPEEARASLGKATASDPAVISALLKTLGGL